MRGLPGSGAYSASKAAALAYLEALRVEMRPHGAANHALVSSDDERRPLDVQQQARAGDGDVVVDNWQPTARSDAFMGYGSAEAAEAVRVMRRGRNVCS